MMPKTSKLQLRNTLSFPNGAKTLSDGLADSSHVGKFTLAFSIVRPASDFQRAYREGDPFPFLIAEHKPPGKPEYSGAMFIVEAGWNYKHCFPSVFPARRELKHTGSQRLREQGLPAIFKRLRSPHSPGGKTLAQRQGEVSHRVTTVSTETTDDIAARRSTKPCNYHTTNVHLTSVIDCV